MKKLLMLALSLAAVAALPSAQASTSCHNLHATHSVKRALLKAFRRAHGGHGSGPRSGSVYYGRCGRTRYAVGDFKLGHSGYDDQPESFSRRPGHSWHDIGDTGGPKCEARVPLALKRVWGLCS